MKVGASMKESFIEQGLRALDQIEVSRRYLSGGTNSQVVLLNEQFLMKSNEPELVRAEVKFLTAVEHPLMQKVLYHHPDFEFAVYNFIPGSMLEEVSDFEEITKKVIAITNTFPVAVENKFGYLYDLKESWIEFLEQELLDIHEEMPAFVPDDSRVRLALKRIADLDFESKLLHGDFGAHNFIQREGELAGVIDPFPLIGDPLYNILFALVSSGNLAKNINHSDSSVHIRLKSASLGFSIPAHQSTRLTRKG
jgi:hypothetical protein